MKRSSAVFLQVVIVLIGIWTLAAMLWFPPNEGRNAHHTLYETYFKDPFLAYVYLSSIPFFAGLYQAVKVLGYVGRNEVYLQRSVRGLRIIKLCALATAGLIVGAEAYIILSFSGKDDIAGPVAMGIFATFASIVIAIAAAVFERTISKEPGLLRVEFKP